MPDLVSAIHAAIPTEYAALAIGVVTDVSGSTAGRVTVNADGYPLALPFVKGYVPSLNDPVLILRQGTRAWVIASLKAGVASGGAGPAPIVPPPQPDTGPQTGTATFTPTGAATYRSGTRRTDTSDLYQGDWTGRGNNTGAWVYGGAPKATLAGKKIAAARMWMRRGAGGSGAAVSPVLGTIAETALPGGTPAVTGAANLSAIGIGQGAWLDITAARADALVNGAAGGLAIASSGTAQYLSIDGPPSDGQSGTIQIDWTV
jgi:hypothetical protein